jgi:uncharacterized protein with beta-barrel porin domain
VNQRWLIAGALALTAGLIAAGCGGGDDNGTTAAAQSKDEFLKRGNQICSAGEKQIIAAENKVLGENPTQAEVNKFATKTAIPTLQYELAGIQGLPPPSGDEDEVDAIVSAAQQGLDKLKGDPSLIAAGGQDNPFAEANKLAKQYGLTACGGD